ncbi:MAG: hypothetical protein L6R38_009699 [Xanthoria sp. 2 TBL-2021]|nr:MAG: hypothetical protein L6R38_009699 [Xanthoria sp. 2 TBL-2021]
MQSFGLFVLSCLAVAAASDIPPPLSTCILNGEPCPTGSTCTPTQTCGGLCLTRATQPPVVPCTVGNDKPCPTNNICTPTQVCPTSAPCGGQCIATIQPPSPPLPTQPCVIGGDECSSGSFCYQTQVCNGLCISTPPTVTSTPTPTPQPCGGHYGRCPKKQKCVDKHNKPCHPGQWCKGTCVPK